jgi:hypothetical protein
MFKIFNDGTLFLNHDNITSVEATPSSNPKAVSICTNDGRIHNITVPDGTRAKEYAFQIATEINRIEAYRADRVIALDAENIVRKVES